MRAWCCSQACRTLDVILACSDMTNAGSCMIQPAMSAAHTGHHHNQHLPVALAGVSADELRLLDLGL